MPNLKHVLPLRYRLLTVGGEGTRNDVALSARQSWFGCSVHRFIIVVKGGKIISFVLPVSFIKLDDSGNPVATGVRDTSWWTVFLD